MCCEGVGRVPSSVWTLLGKVRVDRFAKASPAFFLNSTSESQGFTSS